jgi:hypothetical protein
MKAPKAIMDFVKFTIANLLEFAANVVAKMNGNPDFPTPDVPVAILTTAIDKLQKAAIDADGGGLVAHKKQSLAKQELIGLLKVQTAYVNRIAKSDVVIILNSGFHLSKQPDPKELLLFWAERGLNPGDVTVGCKAIKGAVAYQWDYCVKEELPGEDDWKLAGISAQRRMGMQNLEERKTVWFRYRGITRAGMMPWRDAIRIVV